MQRYFLTETYRENQVIEVAGEVFHHAVHVMRMTKGSTCYLVFSDGPVILAEVVAIGEDTVEFRAVSQLTEQTELPVAVTIACGFPKGDKLEWVAQKATELGAHHIIGFPAAASVVKWDDKKRRKKQQRLQKIAQEAAEQSHRTHIPKVSLLESLDGLLDSFTDYDVVLVAYEESAKQGELSQFAQAVRRLKPDSRVLAVFGPEGGLSPDEIKKMTSQQGLLCGLGPRILRAETAPLYVLSAISYHWELLAEQEA